MWVSEQRQTTSENPAMNYGACYCSASSFTPTQTLYQANSGVPCPERLEGAAQCNDRVLDGGGAVTPSDTQQQTTPSTTSLL